jgi:hypothetical protein
VVNAPGTTLPSDCICSLSSPIALAAVKASSMSPGSIT